MADDIAVTPGSGATVAADDVGGKLHQRVKLSLGADGTAVDAGAGAGAVGTDTQRVTLASDDPAVTSLAAIDDWDESDRAKVNTIAGQAGVQGGSGAVSANTQRVVLATDVAIPAGTNLIGKFGIDQTTPGTTDRVTVGGVTLIDVTLSLDTSAYANGDLLADTQAVAGAVRVNDGTGILHSVMIIDEDDQGAAFDIYFLSANNTLGTENSAPSISDSNSRDILCRVSVATADYSDLGGVKVANLHSLNRIIKGASGSTSIYVAVVNGTGTPTYTASGVKLRIGIIQN